MNHILDPLAQIEQDRAQAKLEKELGAYLWLIDHDPEVRREALDYWQIDEESLQPGGSGIVLIGEIQHLYSGISTNLSYSLPLCSNLDLHVAWLRNEDLRPDFDEAREILRRVAQEQKSDSIGTVAELGVLKSLQLEQESFNHMLGLGDSILNVDQHLRASQLRIFRLQWLQKLIQSNFGAEALSDHRDILQQRWDNCFQKSDLLAYFCGKFSV
jgi:hypothetical protein